MAHHTDGLRSALAELKRELDGIDQALERLAATLRGEAITKIGRGGEMQNTQGGSLSRRITKPVRPDRASRDARARRVEVETAAAVLARQLNRPVGDVRDMLDEELKGGGTLAEAKRRVRARVDEGNA